MGRESTLRGSGRNASGPLLATWQMLEWIRDNGPADRETIKDACAGFVDPGYARRWYQRHIQRPQNAKRRITQGPKPSALDLGAIDLDRAQRAVITALLQEGLRSGSLKRSDDGYTFLRLPKRTPAGLAVEQVTSDPAVQARHVYEMELVRQLRNANKRGAFNHGPGAPRLLKKELAALFNWLATYDGTEQVTITGVELDAIVALRNLRTRGVESPHTQATTAEKEAVRALWLALDHHIPTA